MDLTNRQIKLLKYIKNGRTAQKICERFKIKPENFENFMYELTYNNKPLFIWSEEPIIENTIIQASNEAISELEKRKKDATRYFITSIIGIFKK